MYVVGAPTLWCDRMNSLPHLGHTRQSSQKSCQIFGKPLGIFLPQHIQRALMVQVLSVTVEIADAPDSFALM